GTSVPKRAEGHKKIGHACARDLCSSFAAPPFGISAANPKGLLNDSIHMYWSGVGHNKMGNALPYFS
ncbi:MAG: hypothetical protein ACK46Z_02190, partial [Bacteroidota bacterium]